MFHSFGLPELIIVLVIILLVFGVGRLSKVAGELGSGVREFKKGLNGNDEVAKPDDASNKNDEQAPRL